MSTPVLAEQVTHRYRQAIDGPPAEVFPLLCPEREKDWLPGWQARMIHSRSGVAEAGAVFATPSDGGEVIWLICAHEPDRHLRFVRFEPAGMLVDITIEVEAAGTGGAQVEVCYTFTATSAAGVALVRARTAAAWQEMMCEWEDRMNAFLRARRAR